MRVFNKEIGNSLSIKSAVGGFLFASICVTINIYVMGCAKTIKIFFWIHANNSTDCFCFYIPNDFQKTDL